MQQLRVCILQHSDGTPPGTVETWLKARDISYETRRLHHGDELPSLDSVDWIISCGGPMNVDETERLPWLDAERRFLALSIAGGKTCLGLCLGGQLLARALGARVKKNDNWEVGWHRLRLDASGEELTVFQWHQDTFEIPVGAKRFASNTICENQGFRYGEHVIGLQFHPETSEAWVKELAADPDWPSGPYVQSPEALLGGLGHLPRMTRWFFGLLSEMEQRARQGGTRRPDLRRL